MFAFGSQQTRPSRVGNWRTPPNDPLLRGCGAGRQTVGSAARRRRQAAKGRWSPGSAVGSGVGSAISATQGQGGHPVVPAPPGFPLLGLRESIIRILLHHMKQTVYVTDNGVQYDAWDHRHQSPKPTPPHGVAADCCGHAPNSTEAPPPRGLVKRNLVFSSRVCWHLSGSLGNYNTTPKPDPPPPHGG